MIPCVRGLEAKDTNTLRLTGSATPGELMETQFCSQLIVREVAITQS
jgi:hypothetical protein